jgi:hypothetical protein
VNRTDVVLRAASVNPKFSEGYWAYSLGLPVAAVLDADVSIRGEPRIVTLLIAAMRAHLRRLRNWIML